MRFAINLSHPNDYKYLKSLVFTGWLSNEKESNGWSRPMYLFSTYRRARINARAFFPYDEVKKRKVIFKELALEKRSFNDIKRIARHEIGHVLGFRHEHIRPESPVECSEIDPYDPVTAYDQSSIMHYAFCGGTGTTLLSSLDREGAAILYP
jgi:hypothetical protein